jgi:hypothetical protein
MSQENVEIVRRAWETVNSDDSDVDDWLGGYVDVWLDEFFDPEIEWHDVPTLPEAGFTADARPSVAISSTTWRPGPIRASRSRT